MRNKSFTILSIAIWMLFAMINFLPAQDWETIKQEDFSNAYPDFQSVFDFYHYNSSVSAYGASGSNSDLCVTTSGNDYYVAFKLDLSSFYEYQVSWNAKTHTYPGANNENLKQFQLYLGTSIDDMSQPISGALDVPYTQNVTQQGEQRSSNIFQGVGGIRYVVLRSTDPSAVTSAQIRYDNFKVERKLVPAVAIPNDILMKEYGTSDLVEVIDLSPDETFELGIYQNSSPPSDIDLALEFVGDQSPHFTGANPPASFNLSQMSSDTLQYSIQPAQSSEEKSYQLAVKYQNYTLKKVTINVAPAPIYCTDFAGADLTINEGETITIGSLCLPEPHPMDGISYTYAWSPSSALNDASIAMPSASPTETTTYAVSVTSSDGEVVGTDEVKITVISTPTPGSTITCEEMGLQDTDIWMYSLCPITNPTAGTCDGVITLNIDEANGPHDFLWNDGSTTQNIDGLCPGTYTVTITNGEGCDWILETTLEGEVMCYLDTLTLDFQITPYCNEDNKGEIQLASFGDSDYKIEWPSTGETGLIISDLLPGGYCVSITDNLLPGCTRFECVTVHADENSCALGAATGEAPVILNEISIKKQPNPAPDYIELLVIGTGNCNEVDIQGYILDDNNGEFSKQTLGTGISPAYLRFPSGEAFSAIPVGTIILIYNSNMGEYPDLQNDLYDFNNDHVLVVPVSALDYVNGSTSEYNPLHYNSNAGSAGKWSSIEQYSLADAFQIRKPNGNYLHGFSHGNNALVNGGPDRMHFSQTDLERNTIAFSGDNPYNPVHFLHTEVRSSPGRANNPANANYIAQLCGGYANEIVQDGFLTVRVFPNPFQQSFHLTLKLLKTTEITIKVHDYLGRNVYENNQAFQSGINQTVVEIREEFPDGLYYVSLYDGDIMIYEQKIIRVQ